MQTQTNTVLSNRKPATVTVDSGEKKLSVQDTSTWLTRNEASDLLGVSTQTLVNYERRGSLHPLHAMRADSNNISRRVTVYDPTELGKLPRYKRPTAVREPGEVAARSYELFSAGKSVNDVVIALREPPDKVLGLREKWLDGGGADFVITSEAREAIAQVVGPFSNIAELLERVTKLKTP